MALALTEYEDGTCAGCGQQMSESMNPDNEDRWTTMPKPHRCFACTALARRAKEYADAPAPHALRFTVGLRARPEHAPPRHQGDRAERE